MISVNFDKNTFTENSWSNFLKAICFSSKKIEHIDYPL